MKKTLCIILALGLGINYANAQKLKDSEVPPLMKSNFSKLHPTAKIDKWEKEKNNYEVEFHEGKTEMSVELGPNGQLVQTETEITVAELPKAVTDYITKNMPGKKAKEAAKIVNDKNEVSYEAEVDEVDFIFDANGTFLRKELEKPDADEKDEKK